MFSKKQLLLFVLLLVFLPFALLLTKLGARIWPRAEMIPANVVVDAQGVLGLMPEPWRALAQGGEDEGRAEIGPVINPVVNLKPAYIRIDHLYDAYDLVSQDKDGLITYDWNKLDRVVEDILSTGALPFFSLSYMPPSLSRDGNPVNEPSSWNDWENLVQATVEHFSGKDNKNLSGVYYEIWNEPDLFGHWNMGCSTWKIGCDSGKDYKTLYYYSVIGATKARNVNPFKIGGPATTGLYLSWVESLLDFCNEKKLKIDFLSWHRYQKDTQVFEDDIKTIEFLIEKYPQFATLEKIISEWGSDSENSPLNDGVFAAAHTLAVVRRFLARIDWAFSFEVKDGRSSENQALWGRWGLLTHQDFGGKPKPRYYALDWLNKLKGERLSLTGEGSSVSAIASKKGSKILILLVNFDPEGRNLENVPVTITNLNSGNYRLKINQFLKEDYQVEDITVGPNGSLGRMFLMVPHFILLLELSPL